MPPFLVQGHPTPAPLTLQTRLGNSRNRRERGSYFRNAGRFTQFASTRLRHFVGQAAWPKAISRLHIFHGRENHACQSVIENASAYSLGDEHERRHRPYHEKVAAVPSRFVNELLCILQARIRYVLASFTKLNTFYPRFWSSEPAPSRPDQFPQSRLVCVLLEERFTGLTSKASKTLSTKQAKNMVLYQAFAIPCPNKILNSPLRQNDAQIGKALTTTSMSWINRARNLLCHDLAVCPFRQLAKRIGTMQSPEAVHWHGCHSNPKCLRILAS